MFLPNPWIDSKIISNLCITLFITVTQVDKIMQKTCLNSFAQWQYHSQWGVTEAWLLLVENYTQYPAETAWDTAGDAIFLRSYGSRYVKK